MFHITTDKTGAKVSRPCRARPGRCPLGGTHFDTKEGADREVERQVSEQAGVGAVATVRQTMRKEQPTTRFTNLTGYRDTSESPYMLDPNGELENLTDVERDTMDNECRTAWQTQANALLAPHGLTLLGDGEVLQKVGDNRPDRLRSQLEDDNQNLGAWLSEQIELPHELYDRWTTINDAG